MKTYTPVASALLLSIFLLCTACSIKRTNSDTSEVRQLQRSTSYISGMAGNTDIIPGTFTSAARIAARYPLDQVPHTLLKKPVDSGTLSSAFGYRLSPLGIPRPKKHKGVDYAAPRGTPIVAAGNGVVVKRYTSSSYGKYVRIRHDNGFETAYAHLSTFENDLKVGTEVMRGQRIGKVGNSGLSTAPHLHFELIYHGQLIDPLLGNS